MGPGEVPGGGADGGRAVEAPPRPEINPGVAPLAFLLGRWVGRGHGSYPTIDSFDYDEDVEFWHVGKPFVGYQQRTRLASGLPGHAESGFWRIAAGDDRIDGGPWTVEATIAHPTGVAEVLVGTVAGTTLEVASVAVARTPTAKQIDAVERRLRVDGDELTYELTMAAVGQPLQVHLRAEMRRVASV
jgi:hypothetical protein